MENEKLSRDAEIALVINTKYSIDEQIALLRQKDTKPDEYQAFYDFCESVKAKIPKESVEE